MYVTHRRPVKSLQQASMLWGLQQRGVQRFSDQIKEMAVNEDGRGGTDNVTKIIGIVIGIYVLAALAPGALETLFDVDTSGWDSQYAAIWAAMIVLIIVGLLMTVWKKYKS